MNIVRVLVALAAGEPQLLKLRNMLTEHGYDVVSIARDGHECIRKARMHRPDIALIDYDLIQYTGCEVAKILSDDEICSVILLLNETQKSLINENAGEWNLAYLLKPINISGLISTIELTLKSNKKIKSLEKEVQGLKDIIETRKIIEKAKRILMKKFNISEDEAFRKIQKQSMDKRLQMIDIAKSIIVLYDI
ncbi:MAG: ANTAR domain-containing response regulator [Ignavibacteriales bacterium]